MQRGRRPVEHRTKNPSNFCQLFGSPHDIQWAAGSGNTIGSQGGASSTAGFAINATETATSGNTAGLVARVLSPIGIPVLIFNNATSPVTGSLISARTLNGVQFSVGGTGNVVSQGTFTGTRLISTVADGTPPLQVASTTLVPNLNAFMLGGNKAGAFAPASGSSSYIQNGISQQAGANFSISGDGGVGGNLFAGGIYSSTGYGIGLTKVLTTGDYNDENLFLGLFAGQNNVVGAGRLNTFSGWDAGGSNTTGDKNTFLGHTAGGTNSVGARNTFLGAGAGESNVTGSDNVFGGYAAGTSSSSGNGNVFDGVYSGLKNLTGGYNAFVGFQAGESNTTGSNNTFVGTDAGDQNNTGSYNVAIGYYAGTNNNTGSDNIYIGNAGANESDTIRIGTNQSQVTYIAGIYNTANYYGVPVNVDSNGKLGIGFSSRRFKEQIRDMGDSTNALMKLRPVTFLYKAEYDKGPRTLQYGLIAEEVAEVYPDLVAYQEDGKPYTVKYQYLTTMLLNEMQKQHTVIVAQRQEIEDLKSELQLQNATMQERLTRLESLVERQTQTAVNLGQK